jgi:EmrB/QacA subfamily drug resistance transporter
MTTTTVRPPETAVADPRATAVVATAAGATFLAFLDVTVVNLAFPDLAQSFRGAGVSDLSWVITGYAVLFAALLAPAGRVADARGRRTMFLAALGLFTASSVLAAVAPSLGLLVAARALQGVGAAGMLPAALGLVLTAVPADKRGRAIGAWGAAGGLAAAFGPSLGGVLVDLLGWRSVFWLNLPLGVLLVVLTLRAVPADGARTAPAQWPDLFGVVSLALGLALVVLALTRSTEWGLATWRTGAVAGVGLTLLLLAVRSSATHPVPALDVSLWRHREFAAANGASLLLGAALYSWLLLGVLFLTQAWRYSVLEAGFAMTPGALAAAVGAVLAGRAVTLQTQRRLVVLGALVYATFAAGITLVLTEEPAFLTIWLPGSLLTGAAMGAALTGLTSAAAGALPPAQFAAGVGLNLTARQVGGALGVAVLALLVSGASSDPLGELFDVYVACAAFATGAAIVATRLVERAR